MTMRVITAMTTTVMMIISVMRRTLITAMTRWERHGDHGRNSRTMAATAGAAAVSRVLPGVSLMSDPLTRWNNSLVHQHTQERRGGAVAAHEGYHVLRRHQDELQRKLTPVIWYNLHIAHHACQLPGQQIALHSNHRISSARALCQCALSDRYCSLLCSWQMNTFVEGADQCSTAPADETGFCDTVQRQALMSLKRRVQM